MISIQVLRSISRWIGLMGFTIALVWTGIAHAQVARTQQMVWVDRAGNVMEKIGDPQAIITGTILSPDQKMIAIRGRNTPDGNDDIWVYMLENNGRKMQKTFHPKLKLKRHPPKRLRTGLTSSKKLKMVGQVVPRRT